MKDNSHCGRFVVSFVSKIESRVDELTKKETKTTAEQSELENLSELFVKTSADNEDPKIKIFIDMGVYSRNRNFRILHSSKIGKNCFLIPASPSESKDPESEDFFVSTLVTSVYWKPGLRILTMATPKGEMKPLQLKNNITNINSSLTSSHSSNFPKIDEFILQWIKNNAYGSNANKNNIRFTNIITFDNSILYNISGTRFCFNVSRDHKSNNVYYVFEPHNGLFSQRCYDPDCKYFRSVENEVPIYLNPFTNTATQTGQP